MTGRRVCAGAATPAAGLALLAALATTGCAAQRTATPAPSCTTTVPGVDPVRLDPEQAANAATIAAVGRRLGLADHAVTVALATAMQESKLRNLPYGDRDSVGLFQQRPSQGWGTAAQIARPTYAATAFYQRLAQVKGWNELPVTQAAQAVQHSAYPEAYGQHEDAARALARATTGQVAAGLTCAHLLRPAALRDDDLRQDARSELGAGGLDPAAGTTAQTTGDLWAAASWLVAHADTYGITSVSAGGRRWTAASGTWTADDTGDPGLHYA